MTHPASAPASSAPAPTTTERGTTVSLAGVAVRWELDDPALAGALAPLIGAAPTCPEPALLTLRCTTRSTARPTRAPDADDGTMAWWHVDGQWVLASGDSLAVIGPDDVCIEVLDAATALRGARHLLGSCLAQALLSRGIVVVHAAGLVRDGRAVLAMGPSGRGKSSLAYAASRHGWGLLADDLVAVRLDAGAVQLHGVARPTTVPRALVTDAELTALPPMEHDPRGRLEDRAAVHVEGWSPLAAVVHLAHSTTGRPHLRPDAGRTSFEALAASHLAPTTPERFRTAFPVVAATARVMTWRLEHALVSPASVAPTVAELDRCLAG